MWQFLLAVAAAGSGIFAMRNFSGDGDSAADASQENTRHRVRVSKHESAKAPVPVNAGESEGLGSENAGPTVGGDSIFRFSSEGSSNQPRVRSGRKKTWKVKENADVFRKRVMVQRPEKRFCFCLKRRKTGKSAITKCRHRCPKDDPSFSWRVGVGILYMMSAGKAEISNLSKSVDEAVKAVEELKSELDKRKSSHCTQFSSPPNRAYDDMKDCECGSSGLTEEPEMNKLEAELESELQKLPGCFTEDCDHLQTVDSYRFGGDGVSPWELDRKLCHLVMERQENQIEKLESDLHSSRSKLGVKEAELEALKECVKRLSQCSLGGSDDEGGTELRSSSSSVVGIKRAMDCESSSTAI